MSAPAPSTSDAFHREKLAMLGQLTAGVAHELNNPIGYIASNLSTLRRYSTALLHLMRRLEQELEPSAQELLRRIQQETRWQVIAQDLPDLLDESVKGAEHLKALVLDLKMLGRQAQTRELIDPGTCVRSALNVLGHQLKQGCEVRTCLPPLPPTPVVRSQIIQALTNLLHNALQAQEGSTARLCVGGHSTPTTITLWVEDDGPGVDPQVAAHLGEPYLTTKPGGTGLGLAIVRHIAQDHGGDVWLEAPQVLRGARFVLTLARPADTP